MISNADLEKQEWRSSDTGDLQRPHSTPFLGKLKISRACEWLSRQYTRKQPDSCQQHKELDKLRRDLMQKEYKKVYTVPVSPEVSGTKGI
ncbi:hypothetical protein H109_04848 [Trichophyton interdigitale MR816]|uniref:Uncharacterized protein n=1 Tax=Trichophyton interdigitale (strain MR816) TaxID=1215338 RepID=A0A059J5Y9_TRIIM|nr:hypothetical protein H109_04848 [Trichophyton interdigitale MR816]